MAGTLGDKSDLAEMLVSLHRRRHRAFLTVYGMDRVLAFVILKSPLSAFSVSADTPVP
jgi:hypothetical protein